jgi:GT2 family glycosyltransferase
MLPKVSVIWLNYNSEYEPDKVRARRELEIAEKSLSSLGKLGYTNYELILLDNNSSNDSMERVKGLIRGSHLGRSEIKLLKKSQNCGFAGAMNAAYGIIDKTAEYVALVHYNVIARADYLTSLIEYVRNNPKVGAAQGIVAKTDCNSLIDTAGAFLNESLDIAFIFMGKPVSTIRSPIRISYVEGVMPIYNVAAVRYVMQDERHLYIPGIWAYYLDDVFLSLIMWNYGYENIVLPIVTGEHCHTTSKSLRFNYFFLRNHIALLVMTNSRHKWLRLLKQLWMITVSVSDLPQRAIILNAMVQGFRMGKQLQKKFGTINVYAAPLVETPLITRHLF